MRPWSGAQGSGLWVLLLLCTAHFAVAEAPATGPIGSLPYIDHRNQPPYLPLTGAVAERYQLGHAVFNTDFLPAGTPGAGRRAGLGPLFNTGSCDECHNEGAHGCGPDRDGPLPDSMVVQLEALPDADVPAWLIRRVIRCMAGSSVPRRLRALRPRAR